MNITDVKIFPVREAKLKAYVSIVLDQAFMVNDLKIIQGREGLFISMPSRRRRNGTYRDIAHPLNSETRQTLQDRVLAAYREVAAEDGDGSSPTESIGSTEAIAPADSSPVGDVQPVAVTPASPPASAVKDPAGEAEAEQTLREIEEAHLSDSFWTVS